MSTTETDDAPKAERATCLYPGCTNLAVEAPAPGPNGRTGPPPRYCEIEEHNAASTFQELKRQEEDGGSADDAA